MAATCNTSTQKERRGFFWASWLVRIVEIGQLWIERERKPIKIDKMKKLKTIAGINL